MTLQEGDKIEVTVKTIEKFGDILRGFQVVEKTYTGIITNKPLGDMCTFYQEGYSLVDHTQIIIKKHERTAPAITQETDHSG